MKSGALVQRGPAVGRAAGSAAGPLGGKAGWIAWQEPRPAGAARHLRLSSRDVQKTSLSPDVRAVLARQPVISAIRNQSYKMCQAMSGARSSPERAVEGKQ